MPLRTGTDTKVCSQPLYRSYFYPFTETTRNCLFLNGTLYSRLSWFSSLTSIFSFLSVLIITQRQDIFAEELFPRKMPHLFVPKTWSGIHERVRSWGFPKWSIPHPDAKDIVPKGTHPLFAGLLPAES